MNEALISHRGPGHLWLASLGQRGMSLGLQRMTDLLQRLGRPQQSQPCIIVGGTDGKGSTSAMIATLLGAAGLRVGHYTSPHLLETRERVLVSQHCVSAQDLDNALQQVQAAALDLELTPFEALTAAALLLFSQSALDVAVLEVGLGGRLDAVNACEPILGVITHLSHDHQAILGRTLAEIAFEKAGIARDGVPLVVADPLLVAAALRRHGRQPRLVGLGADLRVTSARIEPSTLQTHGTIEYSGWKAPVDVGLGLPGQHQVENAALALAAYTELRVMLGEKVGQVLPEAATVATALTQTNWPLRAEIMSLEPLLLIDSAHNPGGMAALASLLAHRGRRWQVLLAVRKDRDPQQIIELLAPIAEAFWLPRVQGETLVPADQLAGMVEEFAPQANVAVASLARCLQAALDHAALGDGVVVTGSQHALGEWLQLGVLQSPRLAARLG